MTYEEFKNKYIGKGIDFDNYYGFQCMDLAEQYNKEVVGAIKIAGNAKDAWVNYDKTKYDRIKNTPSGIPQKGDIVIWGAMPGNPYGHIAIFDNGDIMKFISLDQNWPVGTITHLQPHNYNYVLGWLHPKVQQNQSQITYDKMQSIMNSSDSIEQKIKKMKDLMIAV